MIKCCSKCGEDKPLGEFPINKLGKDGYHSQCKLCRNEYKKTYKKKNREILKVKRSEYYRKNFKVIQKRKRVYFQDNKGRICERVKAYNRKNPHLKCWRDLVYTTINKLGGTKEGHTIDVLGYSALDLKNHIESLFTEGMSWGNHGEWHIDHINGIITFPPKTKPHIVNTLSNLRPLWATTRTINGILYEGNLNRPKFN